MSEANANVADATKTEKPAIAAKVSPPKARVAKVGDNVMLIGNTGSKHVGRLMYPATITAVGKGGKIDLVSDDGEHVIHSSKFDPTNSMPDHWNFAD